MNTFGKKFCVTLFGTSHSEELGVVIDGCPAGITINTDDLIFELEQRKSNLVGTTERKETDVPKVIGLFNGKSTGATITIIFSNSNVKDEYNKEIMRPSHCDFVAKHKYNGFNDYRGGGQFSGRMTVCLVAAGFIAKQLLNDIKINAKIHSIGGTINDLQHNTKINSLIKKIIDNNDSIGGIIECNITNVPIGLGEPFFDSVESVISHLMFSIPGCKGIEFGTGFMLANMSGSEANDCFIDETGKTKTNHSGGINAGITNGNEVNFRAIFRPTPSIKKKQWTFDFANNKMQKLELKGRFDTCYVLRTPIIVEAVVAIAFAELSL